MKRDTCPRCGTKVQTDAQFCGECGYRFEEEDKEPETQKSIPVQEIKAGGNKNSLLYILIGTTLVLCLGIGGYFLHKQGQIEDTIEQQQTQLSQAEIEKNQALQEAQQAKDEAQQAKDEAEEAKEALLEKQEQSQSTQYTKYKTNYNMSIRESSDYDATKVGRISKGETVKIVEEVSGSKNSIWGKIEDGKWICIRDNDYVYLSIQ